MEEKDNSVAEPEEGEAGQPERREFTPEELKKVLEEHGKWLVWGEKEGTKANLQNAVLYKANLQNASLWKANLERTNLARADLRGAVLGKANLQEAYLVEANLQDAHLGGANLAGANLQVAVLPAADLHGANLAGADLRGADLEGDKDKGLPSADLYRVKTLYNAKLDPEVKKQIKEKYPHLLEKPKY